MKHCRVEVDLRALAANVDALRNALAPGTEILFVVKADAYGHGLVPVARCAYARGVRWFAVVALERALQLRQALPQARILLLGVSDPDDLEQLVGERITPIIADADHALELGRAAAAARLRPEVHLKIDTGMGRMGIPWDRALDLPARGLRSLKVTGLCSHFASADPAQASASRSQVRRFKLVARSLEEQFRRRLMKHMANSGAVLRGPLWDYDAVRTGLLLYGYPPVAPRRSVPVAPLLQWKAHIVHIKRLPAGAPVGYDATCRMKRAGDIGIVNAGYADGYPRALSNRGRVLVGGRPRRVLGRVSMNWIAVDLGSHHGIQRGAEAVLLGRQQEAEQWADSLARRARTIPYGILTGIHPAVPRHYT